MTAVGYYFMLKNYGMLATEAKDNWFAAVVIVACYCAGSSLVMWLAEKINESGIGNGVSLILFVTIISGQVSSLRSARLSSPLLW